MNNSIPFASLWLEGWELATESAAVVALRMTAFAMMEDGAHQEAERMVAEKVKTAAMLPWLAASGALEIGPVAVTRGSMAHMKRTVSANRRRLGGTTKKTRSRRT